MPRAIWSGSIGFGLVNVPVKLFSATEEKDVHFHQFEEGTTDRIRNKRVNEETGEEVEYDRIVKGYEVSKDRYVMLTPEELESVEPGRTRTIEIEEFVDLTEVDPIYFEKTYFLGPDGDGAERPYALLLDAMASSGKVAIARFVMRTKQYLAAVRPGDGVLLLETMHFPDEVRSTKDLDLPGKVKLSDKERKIAKQLVDSLADEFDPGRYHDTYRERVEELIRAKGKGEEIAVERPQEDGKVLDLMAALEASVKSAREGRGGRGRGAKERTSSAAGSTAGAQTSTAKKTPAKEAVAKRTAAARKTAAKRSTTKAASGGGGTKRASAKKAAPRKKSA